MFKQIKYFQAVVRCKSFTEAAEECYIYQSAISQQIQALKNELGVKLLKREKRKFFLTPAVVSRIPCCIMRFLILDWNFKERGQIYTRITHGKNGGRQTSDPAASAFNVVTPAPTAPHRGHPGPGPGQ